MRPTCTSGKKCMDKRSALTLKNTTRELHHIEMKEYWCAWCNYWHLTTVKTNSKHRFNHKEDLYD